MVNELEGILDQPHEPVNPLENTSSESTVQTADAPPGSDGGKGGQQSSTILVRPIDGYGSNEDEEDWGAVDQHLLRLTTAVYADGIGEMVQDRPEPRAISNAVSQQSEDMPSSFGVSNALWAWGQFIDHDLDLTEAGTSEFAPIAVPLGDPWFDPDSDGTAFIPFARVDYEADSGETSPRAYVNEITAYLDASMVYGSDAATAAALRDSGGRLLIGEDGMLPETEGGNILAGDVRAAENVALSSLHTLFVREHNRWVETLEEEHSDWSDEDLYHAARQRVEAEIQAITFNDFLPILVGDKAIESYKGFDETVNPGITVEFSTAAYRFGHSLLSASIERQNEDGSTHEAGDLALRDAFFNPAELAATGIDPILRGLAGSKAQELDPMVVEDVRSFLFGDPGDGGLDLAAINIQRGRDLGLPSYNDLREALGLERVEDFSEITSNSDLAARLASIYGEVDLIDAWVGGLAEDPAEGLLGETFALVVADQFLRLRDGDGYWSQAGGLSKDEVDALWDTNLADIIERNTEITTIQDEIFFAYERQGGDEGRDRLSGSNESDLLLGFAGSDRLCGLAGDDQLDGGAGRDFLNGGKGDDVLEGGLGKDIFAFTLKTDHDRIVDFAAGDQVRIKTGGRSIDLDKALRAEGDDLVLTLSKKTSILFENLDEEDLAANAILFV